MYFTSHNNSVLLFQGTVKCEEGFRAHLNRILKTPIHKEGSQNLWKCPLDPLEEVLVKAQEQIRARESPFQSLEDSLFFASRYFFHCLANAQSFVLSTRERKRGRIWIRLSLPQLLVENVYQVNKCHSWPVHLSTLLLRITSGHPLGSVKNIYLLESRSRT